jgi:uncharacterized membrane protein YgcG
LVHDFAGVISDDKKAEIQAKAQRLKDEYKTEIALVTIDSLQGEDSFDYSMRMARSWGIGSPDNEIRGLLILVAVKDRKTSFRTSRHIEGEIPDAVTYQVNQTMNAYFKDGDFGGGLSAGMDKILARLQSVYEPTATTTTPQKQLSGWVWFWLVFWAGVIVIGAIGAIRKRWRGRARQHEAAARERRASFFSESQGQRPNPAYAKKQSRSQKRKPAARNNRAKSKKARSASSSYQSSSSSSNYDSSYSSSSGSSSSYDSGSSSSYDSGSSYSGGSDFGGGGSESSW